MSFAKFQMNDLGDGHVEVLEMRPVSLGVLTSKPVAERFVEFLNMIDGDELSNEFDDPEVVLVEAAIDDALASPATPETIVAGVLFPRADVEQEAAPLSRQEEETPLQEAFRRIGAGEAVGVVADDLGMPMPRLRAQWAARVKQQQKGANASHAAAAICEQVACRVCSRLHKATIASDGLCARCSKDVGGA